MATISDTLAEVHQIAGQAQGEIALGLAAHRGVSRAKLREWAEWFQQSADILRDFERSLPVRQEQEDGSTPQD